MTREELLTYLSKRVTTMGSRRAAAQQWGISAQYLGDVLHARREPGPRLLTALGLRRHVTYVKEE